MAGTTGTDLNSPLSESTFLILLSLALGPRHGYAIMKDVEALSNGRVLLSTGTLYGALKRLLGREWIRRVVPQDAKDGEGPGLPRKAYVLTEEGRRALDGEVCRLRSLLAAAGSQTSEALG